METWRSRTSGFKLRPPWSLEVIDTTFSSIGSRLRDLAAQDIGALRLHAERYFTTISIQYSPLAALKARLFGGGARLGSRGARRQAFPHQVMRAIER